MFHRREVSARIPDYYGFQGMFRQIHRIGIYLHYPTESSYNEVNRDVFEGSIGQMHSCLLLRARAPHHFVAFFAGFAYANLRSWHFAESEPRRLVLSNVPIRKKRLRGKCRSQNCSARLRRRAQKTHRRMRVNSVPYMLGKRRSSFPGGVPFSHPVANASFLILVVYAVS